MNPKDMNKARTMTRLSVAATIMAAVMLLSAAAYAAVPGITGTGNVGTFNLTAQTAYIVLPDGASLYSWGYGCAAGSTPSYAPATLTITPFCNPMQVPGPTLIVRAPASGTSTVTVNLTNNLPASAGNTSILFPGFTVTTSGGVPGLLTQEAAPGSTVTYTLTIPSTAGGTHSYYSGTQGDLQVEMGLFGAIVVLPATIPANCNEANQTIRTNLFGVPSYSGTQELDFRLAKAAFNHPKACYDREYLFQLSEMDPEIHRQAEVQAKKTCPAGATSGCMEVATQPYHPAYYLMNGRSMPDDMDTNYAVQYPHQPYNGNPHMHPGELVLLRIIGQGRWQHPFHEHANHVRILARDGNLILTPPDATGTPQLAGPLLFTTTTTPGETMDGLFYYTGKGMNYDMYGHNPNSSDPLSQLPCEPDSNGYYTSDTTAANYFEWCQDHLKPIQVFPFGDVASGGPATLPDPTILTNGPWFGGSPYLGPDATTRATFGTCDAAGNCSTSGTTPPSGTIANSPATEAGFSFMWHSHNEREITTNNIFPGGLLMMMLVDSREFVIDESN